MAAPPVPANIVVGSTTYYALSFFGLPMNLAWGSPVAQYFVVGAKAGTYFNPIGGA
jgi:hypothetical protein